METKANASKEAFLFLAITLGLSFFVFWGPLALLQIPAISFVSGETGPLWAVILFMLGGFVPSLVALFLTWQREGKPGLKRLGRRIVQFNIGWRWYLAVFAIVICSTAGQLLIIRLLGQQFDFSLFIAQLGSFLPLLIIGPLSEEIGWRGYALDRLQPRWSPIASAMIVGVCWAFWHLPLFFIVGTSQNVLQLPFLGFLCGLIAISILFAWLQNHTGGSIWTAIFFHWLYTYSAQVVASGVNRSVTYNLLEYLPYVILAVVVVLIWKGKTTLQWQRA